MANRYNNRRIIKSGQKVSVGKLLPGMILTFNYSEKGVKDPRPIMLFLHNEKGLVEGININYLNPTKLKKLFSVIEFKKGKLDGPLIAVPAVEDEPVEEENNISLPQQIEKKTCNEYQCDTFVNWPNYLCKYHTQKHLMGEVVYVRKQWWEDSLYSKTTNSVLIKK